MADHIDISLLAVLHHLNDIKFKKKVSSFPEDKRFYVVLASSVIGLEISRRVEETPCTVVEDSEEFVSKLLGMTDLERDDTFGNILETCLVESMEDELGFCCPNCRNFNKCLKLENSRAGSLFQRLVNGEETEKLKKEIRIEVEKALLQTPHVDSEEAHKLCKDFIHQYNSSNIGELFGRYAEIAALLQADFGIDNKHILQHMVSLNMRFIEKLGGAASGSAA